MSGPGVDLRSAGQDIEDPGTEVGQTTGLVLEVGQDHRVDRGQGAGKEQGQRTSPVVKGTIQIDLINRTEEGISFFSCNCQLLNNILINL